MLLGQLIEQGIGTTHFFNLENVTGDDFGRLDFIEATVTENHGFQGKGLLEFVDNGASLEFLYEADRGVQKEQCANDAEIYPVLKTSGKDSSSLNSSECVLCSILGGYGRF